MAFFSEPSQSRPADLPQIRHEPGSTISNILQLKAFVTEFIIRKLLGEHGAFLLWEYSLFERQVLVLSVFWSLTEHYTNTNFQNISVSHLGESSFSFAFLIEGPCEIRHPNFFLYNVFLQNVCVISEVVSKVWKQLPKNWMCPFPDRAGRSCLNEAFKQEYFVGFANFFG